MSMICSFLIKIYIVLVEKNFDWQSKARVLINLRSENVSETLL